MRINQRKGAKNIWGPALRRAREQSRLKMTQVDLAELLTSMGLPMDRSAVSRIENQERFLRDIELHYFVRALRINFYRLGELLLKQPNVIPDYADYRATDLDEELQVAEDDSEDDW
jgi:transcriptional regulator with XRE-family HTH domain